MEFLQQLLPVILFSLLSILVIVLIILVINVIKTIKHVNILMEDIENKSKKLDGLFNVVDTMSTSLSGLGDKIVKFLTSAIKKIIKKKRKEDIDE